VHLVILLILFLLGAEFVVIHALFLG